MNRMASSAATTASVTLVSDRRYRLPALPYSSAADEDEDDPAEDGSVIDILSLVLPLPLPLPETEAELLAPSPFEGTLVVAVSRDDADADGEIDGDAVALLVAVDVVVVVVVVVVIDFILTGDERDEAVARVVTGEARCDPLAAVSILAPGKGAASAASAATDTAVVVADSCATYGDVVRSGESVGVMALPISPPPPPPLQMDAVEADADKEAADADADMAVAGSGWSDKAEDDEETDAEADADADEAVSSLARLVDLTMPPAPCHVSQNQKICTEQKGLTLNEHQRKHQTTKSRWQSSIAKHRDKME
jgi:hypothetical protein